MSVRKGESRAEYLKRAEREMWAALFAKHDTVTEVAKAAGVARQNVYEMAVACGYAIPHLRRYRRGGNDAWRSLGI